MSDQDDVHREAVHDWLDSDVHAEAAAERRDIARDEAQAQAHWAERCARDSGWCDGRLCAENGIDCPRADPPAPAPAAITRYYSFGFGHAHAVNGFTWDKDVIAKVTAVDPRGVMLRTFGQKWSMEYTAETLDLSFFPRGVKELRAE